MMTTWCMKMHDSAFVSVGAMKSPQNMWFQKQNIYLKPSKNGSFSNPLSHKISWCFQIYLLFHLYLGRWSNLTIIFFRWVGEKPPTRDDFMICCIPSQDSEDSNSNTQSSDSTEDPRFDDGDLWPWDFMKLCTCFFVGVKSPKKKWTTLILGPFFPRQKYVSGLKPCSPRWLPRLFVVAKDRSVVSTDQDKNGTVCQSMRMHV